MRFLPTSSPSKVSVVLAVLAVGLLVASGCAGQAKKKRASTTQPVVRYQSYGLREVPEYLKNTVYERVNVQDLRPMVVSGWGLVTQLRGTGDNSAIPTPVRDYIRRELLRLGYSTVQNPIGPEQVMRDPTNAVVRVDTLIPAGARQNDRVDAFVSAPAESYTTSLSHGMLMRASLAPMGADRLATINVYAMAEGPVFVNPEYALADQKNLDANARNSLRYGVIMDGGLNLYDNPIVLRVRDPQYSTAMAVAQRINQRFQNVADKIGQQGRLAQAQPQDDAIVYVYLPRAYRGNAEHFAGVVKHLYMESNPAYLATIAEKLGEAAMAPDAPLENISYAMEGIGPPAEQVLEKLMLNSRPEIAYAAARAAAFIGDDLEQARSLLVKMANTPDHPFRLNAVQTLSELPQSSETDQYLRQLINADNTAIRVAAYKALVRNNDPRVYSRVIREKFVLDLVPSSAPPMIYATRQGIPRLAIFGVRQSLATPLTFAAINSRLTLTADKAEGPVTLFYRADRNYGDKVNTTIKQMSRADLPDIIARLGGQASQEEVPLDFSYADVVALLKAMNDAGKLQAQTMDGLPAKSVLVIEEGSALTTDNIADAPQIPELERKQGVENDLMAPPIPDSEKPGQAQPGERPKEPKEPKEQPTGSTGDRKN